MSIPLPRGRPRSGLSSTALGTAALASRFRFMVLIAAALAVPFIGACGGESGEEAEARIPETGVRPTPPPETWTPPRRAADPDTTEQGTPTASASEADGERTSAGEEAADTTGPRVSAGEAPDTVDGPAPAAASRRAAVPDLGHTLGSNRAPVQVLEFSDFGCGYCRQFHLETWPSLQEEFVETGKVEWTYVPMTLGMFGANSIHAAEAGECAIEQGRFPPVRDRLFQEQARWKRSGDAHSVFREIVDEEGLDVEQWQSCMDEDRRLARVDDGTRLAQQIGVRGTPTFLVLEEGAIPGAVPLEVFRQILDQLYARRSGS